MLYTLTATGVAYLIRLKSNLDYGTSFVPASEVIEYNTQIQPHYGAITAVTASEGYLLIGRIDGSIGGFQLGILDPSDPGLQYTSIINFFLRIYVSFALLLSQFSG